MAERKKPAKSKASAKAAGKGRRKAPAKAPLAAPSAAPSAARGGGPTYLFDDKRNIKRLIYAVYAVCGVSFLLDFVVHRHVDHPWESLFGFYAVYGLVGFVVLVLAAKQLRKVLMRREGYYDD